MLYLKHFVGYSLYISAVAMENKRIRLLQNFLTSSAAVTLQGERGFNKLN